MSVMTTALYQALRCDLSKHLDTRQLSDMDSGEPLWPDADRKSVV